MNNKFNIGDILIPTERHKGNTWIVLNVIYPADQYVSYYVLQNLEDEDEVEALYCEHIERYYKRPND